MAALVEIKKKFLTERSDFLTKQWESLLNQINITLSAADRVILEEQAKRLEEEIEKVNRELDELRGAGGSSPPGPYGTPKPRSLEAESYFHYMDFKKADEILDAILQEPGREAYAALLLLQKSFSLGGKWCVARIRDRLGRETRDFKHYEIEFSPEERWDEFGLLNRLAQYLFSDAALRQDIPAMRVDLADYTRKVVKKMAGSLQNGSVAFIEFRTWDNIFHDQILSWIFESLWSNLIDELDTVAKTYINVKLFIVILVDAELPSGCLTSVFRWVGDNQDCIRFLTRPLKDRVVELPLANWTETDIAEWLGKYAAPLKKAQVRALAQAVYAASNSGTPQLVCDALRERLDKRN